MKRAPWRGDRTPEMFGERARDVVRRGYTALKFDPFGSNWRIMDPYELDLDAIMKEAARTRTCLEVNSNFHRLDLNDLHCRKAREMGVHVIISTDSHNYDDLLNLPYGVATAQRGWIEKDRVLNAQPVEDMLAFKSRS